MGYEGSFRAMLAQAQLGTGDADGARSTAQQAIVISRRHGTRLFELSGELALGRALVAASAVADASAALDRAMALTEQSRYEQ